MIIHLRFTSILRIQTCYFSAHPSTDISKHHKFSINAWFVQKTLQFNKNSSKRIISSPATFTFVFLDDPFSLNLIVREPLSRICINDPWVPWRSQKNYFISLHLSDHLFLTEVELFSGTCCVHLAWTKTDSWGLSPASCIVMSKSM